MDEKSNNWELFDPYHDRRGRFTGKGGASRGGGAAQEKGEPRPGAVSAAKPKTAAEAHALVSEMANAGATREQIHKAVLPEKPGTIHFHHELPWGDDPHGRTAVNIGGTAPTFHARTNAERGLIEFNKMVTNRPSTSGYRPGLVTVVGAPSFRIGAVPHIMVKSNEEPSGVVFALGHWLAHRDLNTRDAANAFLAKRKTGEFAGKTAGEVIGKGLAAMHSDPGAFAKRDPEHFKLIFNVMHNKLS